MSCNNTIDVSEYMKYVRDVELSINDTEEILQDVIFEIAEDTKMFKNTFAFDIEKCDEVYDIKALYGLSQVMKYDTNDVEEENYSTEDLIAILQGKDLPDKNAGKECKGTKEDSSVNENKTNTSCINTYMNLIDILYFDTNNKKYPLMSVVNRWFDKVNESLLEIIPANISEDTGVSYSNMTLNNPITVIAHVSIIPSINNLTSDDERILKPAIIAGLKYKASDLYMNAVNEQVSNLLFQRFYNAKKQLAFTFPQFISHVRRRNREWNI